ncbi:FRG domain-containing protein [Leptospira neocaledonica]|uniref:FRG domain-containing protein n=1 Tax=Leptospira neocaledonica TaxID=2023192 RepID=A0A2M9ZTA6_9LEPT|nr:FRG domain-containing protein [Leptospira neocaledonica]PJZ75286.1 hypothetical protein CH365_19685 [Leptospira neocaledonica]
MKIKKYNFDSIENILDYMRALAITKKSYIFRGIPKEKYSLTTTVERDYDLEDLRDGGYGIDETIALEKFFRAAYHYESEWKFDPDSILEIWSLIQHHGGRTRLLDFTHSFPVALYFSFWKLEEDFDPAIWCFNREILKDKLVASVQNLLPNKSKYESVYGYSNRFTRNRWKEEELLRSLRPENSLLNILLHYSMKGFWSEKNASIPNLMIPIEPLRMNRRLIMQNGCFLMPINSRTSSMINLVSMLKGEDVQELKIDYEYEAPTFENFQKAFEMKENMVINLKQVKTQNCTYLLGGLNIRGETLFPDFQGLITSATKLGRIPKHLR